MERRGHGRPDRYFAFESHWWSLQADRRRRLAGSVNICIIWSEGAVDDFFGEGFVGGLTSEQP